MAFFPSHLAQEEYTQEKQTRAPEPRTPRASRNFSLRAMLSAKKKENDSTTPDSQATVLHYTPPAYDSGPTTPQSQSTTPDSRLTTTYSQLTTLNSRPSTPQETEHRPLSSGSSGSAHSSIIVHEICTARAVPQGRLVRSGEIRIVNIPARRKTRFTGTTRSDVRFHDLLTPSSSSRSPSPPYRAKNIHPWCLPDSAKYATLAAIEQIDKFHSQVAGLEASEQKETLTAALSGTKATLMKKFGVRSIAEYLALDEIIFRNLEVVKLAQAVLLTKRKLELLEENDDDEGSIEAFTPEEDSAGQALTPEEPDDINVVAATEKGDDDVRAVTEDLAEEDSGDDQDLFFEASESQEDLAFRPSGRRERSSI